VAATLSGLSKPTLARALAAAGAAFGLTSVVAPRAIATAYAVPPTPQGLQLQRLFGSRALVISLAAMTARTDDEVDRWLGWVAVLNLIDTVTALSAARGSERPTTVRAVASSAAYGGAALALRLMKKQ
jgi:hypothetical protein